MKFRLRTYGTDETVTRPVQLSILKDISKFIGCRTEPYLHIDENSNIKKTRSRRRRLKGSSSAPLNVFNDNVKEMLRITDYTEVTDEGTETSLALNNPDSVPFLLDKDIKFATRLIMQRKRVDMTVEYITTDKVYMSSTLDMLRLHMPYNEGKMLHNIQYTVQVPKELLYLTIEILKLKNKRLPENMMSIGNYLNSISDGRLTKYVDPSGDMRTADLAIKQMYHSYKGWFNDSFSAIKPEPTENNGESISLSYTFYYDKPIGIHVDMPIIVYNTPLPSNITKSLSMYSGSVPHSSKLVNHNDQGLIHYFNPGKHAYDCINKFKDRVIPSIDDYVDLPLPKDIVRLGTMSVCIEDDKKSIDTLENIMKAFSVIDSVFDLITKQERENIFKLYNSLLWLTLIREDKFSTSEVLEIDDKGIVVSKEELDLTKRYRLLLCLNTDINVLSRSSLERLKENIKENNENYKLIQSAKIEDFLKEKKLSVKDLYYYKEQIIDVKNNYLSTFDLLKPAYGVSQEELDRLAKIQGNDVEVFFRLMKNRDLGAIGKTVQTNTTIITRFFKEK